jgi:acyl-CoA reductase-like NAD-dependent aldehyde dehydrogenase
MKSMRSAQLRPPMPRSLEERKAWLQRIADALTERLDDLKAITIAEYGAPVTFAEYIVDQARNFFVPNVARPMRTRSTGLWTSMTSRPWEST